MEFWFLFCLICDCVWYVYVDLIKLLVGDNGSFWAELAMYLTYLGRHQAPQF